MKQFSTIYLVFQIEAQIKILLLVSNKTQYNLIPLYTSVHKSIPLRFWILLLTILSCSLCSFLIIRYQSIDECPYDTSSVATRRPNSYPNFNFFAEIECVNPKNGRTKRKNLRFYRILNSKQWKNMKWYSSTLKWYCPMKGEKLIITPLVKYLGPTTNLNNFDDILWRKCYALHY